MKVVSNKVIMSLSMCLLESNAASHQGTRHPLHKDDAISRAQ